MQATKDAASAIGLSEDALIRFLLSRQDIKSILFAELGLPEDTFVSEGVVLPFVTDRNKKPGDIDILLCGPKQPHRAVAIEVKRVKVSADGGGSQKVNKLGDVSGGLLQAKALADLGFARVYFAILVVVDGRLENEEGNYLDRRMGESAAQKVIEVPSWPSIRPDVGILYFEIVQTVDKPIERAGLIGLAIAKPAMLREQPSDLTTLVERYVEIHGTKQP